MGNQLPLLPAGKSWSPRKTIQISFTNTQTSSQSFYIGNDSGTSSNTTGTLTIGGTFGTNTAAVIKSMSRVRTHFITDMKVVGTGTSADTITPAQNLGLKIQRNLMNGSGQFKIFDNTDVSTRQDQQTNIFPWAGVNWLFVGEDEISGTITAADSTKNLIITLTIGYNTILGK